MSYPARSRLDPRILVASSSIDRQGLFASAPIAEGEQVIIWGGRVISDCELRDLEAAYRATGAEYSCSAVGEDLNLLQAADDPLRYGNHACDPNLWMDGDGAEVARRPIAAGEELTIDYATVSVSPAWRMTCLCGAANCRGKVTGDDWRRSDLQARYGDHFLPFINARIRAARGGVS